MPGTYCAVRLCRNNNKKNRNLSFHRFPKDEKLMKEWLIRCKRDGEINASQGCVCSEHFSPEMFQEDIRAKVMNLPGRRVLNRGAIPIYKLSGVDDIPRETSRSKRMKLREEKEKHNAIIQDLLSNLRKESESTNELGTVVASDKRLSDPTVRQNVPNDESLSNHNTLDKSLSEPIFRKNVLLDERKTESPNKHHELVTSYKKLYEELLQKYEAKNRENAELIRRNEELVKIIKETERHNFTQGML